MLISASLTDSEFIKFSDLIYKQAGIFLKPEKKELLNARLTKRLRICQISTFKEYFDFINTPAQQKLEFLHFIDSISTNFTSFYRETSHFEFLKSRVLPELLTNNSGGNLFLWSSASSSGEEPYTLAMVLDEYSQSVQRMKFNILATDISTKVLGIASNGVYSSEQAAKVPPATLKKYFQKGRNNSHGKVKIKKNIRAHVTFKRFNLMHDFPWNSEMDVIFCRNVMIYFDRSTQETLIKKFYKCLRPGGYLFIGHSESIASIKHVFLQVEATTYKKE